MWAYNNGMSLTHLDVSHNRIGPTGFTDMTQDGLGRGLKYLNLETNGIDLPDGLPVQLQMDTLVYLNLGDNRFGDDYIGRLIRGLSTATALTTLDLHNTGVETQGVRGLPKAIRELSQLTRLKLTHNPLITEGMRREILTAWLDMGKDIEKLDMDPFAGPSREFGKR